LFSVETLAAYVVRKNILGNDSFRFVDVGASGGLLPEWLRFGESLDVEAFDVLVDECDRLRARYGTPRIRYNDGWIRSERFARLREAEGVAGRDNRPERLMVDEIRQWVPCPVTYGRFSGSMKPSTRSFSLDDFFRDADRQLDFLKVDTDGADLEVLHSAESLFDAGHFLFARVETSFHGPSGSTVSCFANVDAFLRGKGFTLLDIIPLCFTRAALPALPDSPTSPYKPTREGALYLADFLYARDLTLPGCDLGALFSDTPRNIVKLACFHEMAGFRDWAADLLLHFRAEVEPLMDVGEALDILASGAAGKPVSYAAHVGEIRETLRGYARFQGDIRFLSDSTAASFVESLGGEPVAFFGAGGRLDLVCDILSRAPEPVNVRYVVDNDQRKWGGAAHGLEIRPPAALAGEPPSHVLVTSIYFKEIYDQLEAMKAEHGLDFGVLLIEQDDDLSSTNQAGRI